MEGLAEAIMGSWRTDIDIASYEQAEEFLGGKDQRRYPVGKVTFIERLSPTRIGVRYQKTVIVEYDTAGRVKLNTGGWFTVTTKAKMNEFLPRRIRVYSTMGKWYVSVGVLQGGTDYDYADGMVILDSNAVYNTRESDHAADRKAYRQGQRWNGTRRIPLGEDGRVWQGWCHICEGDVDMLCTRCGRGVRARRASEHEHRAMVQALNEERGWSQISSWVSLELDRRDALWRAAQMRRITQDPADESAVYVPEFAKTERKA